jgi:hypothetical protein
MSASDLAVSFFVLLGIAVGFTLLRRFGPRLATAWGTVRARDTRWGRWLLSPRAALAVLVIAAIGALTFWFADLAYSHDHAEHCFKAYHFWHQMLGRGRLRGWTHFLGFGYPSGELTPFGPELWVALFRAATLGLLSWTHTYALAFSSVVVFAVIAILVFTRRFFGTAAGVVAATIWALDPGNWYQGGFFWFEWLGVWPVTLATSLTLLALVKLGDILFADPVAGRGRDRDLLWAVFWIATSLIVHQLPIVVYAITLPCLLLAVWLRHERIPRARVTRFAAAVGLGLGVAAFYLLPMFARNGLTQDLGVRGYSREDLAHRLVEMRLFDSAWSPIIVLGLLGAVRAVRDRAATRLFFVLCMALFVVLASDILVSVFHLERLMPGILKIEAPRMLLIAKLFFFPLAAYAAVGFFRSPPGEATAAGPSLVRRAAGWLILAALGAPLLAPSVLHLFHIQIDKSVEHREGSPLANDLNAFFAWSRAERTASKDLYRIAYTLVDRHDHIISISPVFNDTFMYKVGYTSAQQFRAFPMSGEPEVYRALLVKYVLSDHDISEPRLALHRVFGGLRVYRFLDYRANQPFTLTGNGTVELTRFDPERIELRLSGISPGARLKLHVATYPRWEASLNGREVSIAPAPVYGMEYPILMEVPVTDGTLVFRYVRRAPDLVGLVASLVAWLILALMLAGRWQAVLASRWGVAALGVGRRVWRVLRWPLGAAVLAAIGLAAWRMASPTRLPRASLFAAQNGSLSLARIPCDRRAPAAWKCGPHKVEATVVSGAYGSHLCLTAPPVGELVLAVPATLGRFIEATYDPSDRIPGRIRVSVDGRMLGDTPTRGEEQGLQFVQVDTGAWNHTTANVRIEVSGAALHCFDVGMAP